jgi:hypothetical protein
MKEDKKLTPLEAINSCISGMWFICGGSYSNHHGGPPARRASLMPGALVERMPERVREGLRQLKGHHFDDLPMDTWRFMDDTYTRKKNASLRLMKFDRDMLRIESKLLQPCPQCEDKDMKLIEGCGLCLSCGYSFG